jgi:hypothetical protein
LSAFVRSVA